MTEFDMIPALQAEIGAVVLAAGMSKRMGSPKMVLPWGSSTVIGHVVNILQLNNIIDIVVVTGGHRELTEKALVNFRVKTAYNPDYENKEMISSLKIGIEGLASSSKAFFVVLGDQPQIAPDIVAEMIQIFNRENSSIIIPSYQMKRGHPWLIKIDFRKEIMDLDDRCSLRDFLNQHNKIIRYLVVENPTVLKDLDTPEDYSQEKPPLTK